ncbi:MAG: hypothetical protein IKH03_06045 [Oscillospiraceae bacterium]|nr:hypothetical protein [Oscillospiraceae bacterium]
MKKLRQIISLVLVLVMFFDYGAVSASYEPASYAVAAVAGLEELIQSTEPEEIQGEEADAAEAPDLAELPEQPEDAQPGEAPEDAQQSEDPDALLQAERVSPLTGLLNQVSRLSAPYRDDGYIHIYNYDMLSLIGTGLPVEAEDVFHGYADNREADAPEAPDWGEEPEQPAEVEQPEQPAQAEQPEQPAQAEQPEQPAEVEQPEQPAEAEQPEQPAEAEQPEQPAQVEQPEQPAEVEQPEQPAEPEQPEQPTEPDEPEQIAAPEASALPEVPEQIGETLLTQALGRALSRVLVRDTAAPQRALTATLAAAVAEVTGEEAAPQELAEEDAPAELQGEAQPETDPDPMTDPAQTAAEPALPAAAGESAPDDSDTLPTDAEPAPDAVPAQDSEEPEAPAATGTSPTEPDADTDTYYNNDENNEEPAPVAEPAEPEEIAEPEDGEAAPPAAQPDLIDDPDVVEGPETGDLSQQPDEPVNEPTDSPDEGSALTESKYYYYPDGELVRYTSDANYYLECDIPLPKENCWTLPEDFTGSFTGNVRPGDAERVYDPETDTIFIQNPLQLLEYANAQRGDSALLMTGDIEISTFGTGMYVFPDGSQGDAALSGVGDPVDYADSNAVFPTSFRLNAPLGATRGAGDMDGRDYSGQVIKNVSGTDYILIGNRQQLDAINSGGNIPVYGPVYSVDIRRKYLTAGSTYTIDEATLALVYPGDADLTGNALLNGTSPQELGTVYNGATSHDGKLYFAVMPGGDPTNSADRITTQTAAVLGTYTKNGNYIIFRDIDMSATGDQVWRPLMFTGTMYGITSDEAYYVKKAALDTTDPDNVISQANFDALPAYCSLEDYLALTEKEQAQYEEVSASNQSVSDIGAILGKDDPETDDALAIFNCRRPELSNINIAPQTRNNITGDPCIDYESGEFGVGFFGTIGNPDDYLEVTNRTVVDSQAYSYSVVKNLKLSHLVVENTATYGYNSESLVSLLTESLGSLLDLILDGLLNVIIQGSLGGFTGSGDIQLNLTGLLDPRSADPSGLATGAFAGRINGTAVVDYCEVSCATVITAETKYEAGTDGSVGVNTENGGLIVGKGGFVGSAAGTPIYLKELLSYLTDALGFISGLLGGRIQIGPIDIPIPGLSQILGAIGLDNILPLVTNNILKLGFFAPVDYQPPQIRHCTADRVTLSNEKNHTGEAVKYGVGGFAGSLTGATVLDCEVSNSDYLVVEAEMFGGGFAGIARDGVINTLLSGLGVNVDLSTLTRYPCSNTQLIECAIRGSDITVQGNSSLGGFVGQMNNSYAINATVDEASRLEVHGDRAGKFEKSYNMVGGFVGKATVGSGASLGDHIKQQADLLSTVADLLNSLLNSDGTGGALLDLAGITPSAVMGCQILGAVNVNTQGSYAGGLVGYGEGAYVTASTAANMNELQMYSKAGHSAPDVLPRCNTVMNLVDVHTDMSFAGGVAGEMSTASGGGLLNLGIAAFAGFKLEDVTVRGISLSDYRNVYYGPGRSKDMCFIPAYGDHDLKFAKYDISYPLDPTRTKDGYRVTATLDYAGGGVGLARGGDVTDVALRELTLVSGRNYVGGFVGATGTGDLLSAGSAGGAGSTGGGGLNVQLLGIQLVDLSGSLAGLVQGIRSSFTRVTVEGTDEGFTVTERGQGTLPTGEEDYVAGGFAGVANSVEINDCHVRKLKYVKANLRDGIAGGFVGKSTIGGLLTASEGETGALTLLSVDNLLGAAPYLVPKFNGCHVGYVNNGYVEGWCAGGFTGDFQSGFVNKETTKDGDKHDYGHDTDRTYYIYHNSGTEDTPNYSALISDCGCTDLNTGNVTTDTVHDSTCACYCCEAERGAYRYGVPGNPWSVENIGYVRGGMYAGGWGGHVYSGALADAGSGGIQLLDGVGLNLSGLLSLFDSYVPMIMYAGVKSSSDPEDENYTSLSTGETPVNNGYAVYAADDYATTGDDDITNDTAPATAGYAGGFIGYGSGIQVSYSDVTYLKTGVISHPDYLERIDGHEYMEDDNFHFKNENRDGYTVNPLNMEYAVAGAYYAGGYAGLMDVGSSASVGDGLSLLGDAVSLTSLVSALNVVVSTVEHCDVVGAPGGFNIIASPRINAPQGHFGKDEYGENADTANMGDGEGVAYAGGFVAKLSGGHMQDSNVSNFEYIVGEVAAGGYVGEMEPGSVANAVGEAGILDRLVNLNNLATLLSDFIPTIRNSQTTCVPCGGAVRAQSPSDRPEHPQDSDTTEILSRGFAGGYVGHMVGGQIWGLDEHEWRTQGETSFVADQTGATVQRNTGLFGSSESVDVMVYVYQAVDANGNVVKDPVYRATETYTDTYLQSKGVPNNSTEYFVPVLNTTTKETSYEIYTVPTGVNLRVTNRPAQGSRRGIEAVEYETTDGRIVYRIENLYSGGDWSNRTELGIPNRNQWFTVEENAITGEVTYVTAGAPTGTTETGNTIGIVVPKSEQLMIDQYQKDDDGNYLDAEGNVVAEPTVLITADIPAYHDYGSNEIFLRGRTVYEPLRQCAAIRIRSVYGREFAGGYCGRMESGSQAETGNISLLGSLLDVSNLLSALEVSYSTIYFGYVNGPMRGGDDIFYTVEPLSTAVYHLNGEDVHLTYLVNGSGAPVDRQSDAVLDRIPEPIEYERFIKWYTYVGQYGGLNFYQLPDGLGNMTKAQFETWLVDTSLYPESSFVQWIERWIYGFNVRAGRGSTSEEHGDAANDGYEIYSATDLSLSSTAGGFIGSMWSGVIHDSESMDARNILAMRATGGFVGEMLTKGLANFGSVSLLGGLIPLNVGSLLSVGDVLVPSIRRSGVTGYQRGLTVLANGDSDYRNLDTLGNAGGFVGASYGGQIGMGEEDEYKGGTTATDYDDAYRARHPYHPKDDGEKRFDEWFRYPETALSKVTEERSNNRFFSVTPGATIWVNNLLTVKGTWSIGGFVGKSTAASVVSADTSEASAGLLQGLLDSVISSPEGLLQALDATVATIKNTVVNALPVPTVPGEKVESYINELRSDEDAFNRAFEKYKKEHPDEFVDELTEAQLAAMKEKLIEQLRKAYIEELKATHLYDDYGIVIDGVYDEDGEGYAPYVGGYAGSLDATVVGQRKSDDTEVVGEYDNNVVNKLRGVYGGKCVGGFFGFADVGSIASVGNDTSVLDLINLGNVNVLDVFRTYIYFSEAKGLDDGIRVIAYDNPSPTGTLTAYKVYGAAGGFGGWMNNGTIEDSKTTNLNYVEAQNYAGGFVGFLGKNQAVDANAEVAGGEGGNGTTPENFWESLGNSPVSGVSSVLDGLLSALGLDTGLSLGALNIIGATVTRCSVVGYGDPADENDVNVGFEVHTLNEQLENDQTETKDLPAACAGGFAGFADISQIENCTVDRLKLVTSKQIAGGFLGRGTKANLLDAEISNKLVSLILGVLTFLLANVLQLGDNGQFNLLDTEVLNLMGTWLGISLLSEGELLRINLFGLQIAVGIGTTEYGMDGKPTTGTIRVILGSSTIMLPVEYDENGRPKLIAEDSDSAISISLIEANRTEVKYCTVTGVLDGYDVHGDGYQVVDSNGNGLDDNDEGTRLKHPWGFAGGFVGYHDSSFFSHNQMYYCDIVAGSTLPYSLAVDGNSVESAARVGPFSGGYSWNPNTSGRNIDYFEGTSNLMNNDNQNIYHIYRNTNASQVQLDSVGRLFGITDSRLTYEDADGNTQYCMRYNVQHRKDGVATYSNAQENPGATYYGVYQFSATNPPPGAHSYLQNAKYVSPTDNNTVTETNLEAYVSEGKARLMLGQILEKNTPHKVLPPVDLNDPCDDIAITLEKEWDHGSNPESEWPESVTYDVYQLVSHEADRDLLVDARNYTDQLADARHLGSYELNTGDQVAMGLDRIKELWRRKLTEVGGDPTAEYRLWGYDGDLPDAYYPSSQQKVLFDGQAYKVFQSNEAMNGLKLVDDKPVPVAGTVGEIPLYFKTAYPKNFVTAEIVQLYYKENEEFKPAYFYNTDEDGHLKYSAKVVQGSPDANGDYSGIYYVREGDPSEYVVIKSNILLRYVYTAPETHTAATGDAAHAGERYTRLVFDFNGYGGDFNGFNTSEITAENDGKLTGIAEYDVTDRDLAQLGALVEDSFAPTDDVHVTTHTGQRFRISYNKATGLLELDYGFDELDINASLPQGDTTHTAVRQITDGYDKYGFNDESELVHYRYDPGSNQKVVDVLIDSDKDREVKSDSYQVTAEGTTTNYRYVVAYDKPSRHFQMFYKEAPLKINASADTAHAADYAPIVLERLDTDNANYRAYYGMNAFSELVLLRYLDTTNVVEGATYGFQLSIDPETGAIDHGYVMTYEDTDHPAVGAVGNDPLTIDNGYFLAGDRYYIVSYDKETRVFTVSSIDEGEVAQFNALNTRYQNGNQSYVFDSQGRMKSVEITVRNPDADSPDVYRFTFDDNGSVTAAQYTHTTVTEENGETVSSTSTTALTGWTLANLTTAGSSQKQYSLSGTVDGQETSFSLGYSEQTVSHAITNNITPAYIYVSDDGSRKLWVNRNGKLLKAQVTKTLYEEIVDEVNSTDDNVVTVQRPYWSRTLTLRFDPQTGEIISGSPSVSGYGLNDAGNQVNITGGNVTAYGWIETDGTYALQSTPQGVNNCYPQGKNGYYLSKNMDSTAEERYTAYYDVNANILYLNMVTDGLQSGDATATVNGQTVKYPIAYMEKVGAAQVYYYDIDSNLVMYEYFNPEDISFDPGQETGASGAGRHYRTETLSKDGFNVVLNPASGAIEKTELIHIETRTQKSWQVGLFGNTLWNYRDVDVSPTQQPPVTVSFVSANADNTEGGFGSAKYYYVSYDKAANTWHVNTDIPAPNAPYAYQPDKDRDVDADTDTKESRLAYLEVTTQPWRCWEGQKETLYYSSEAEGSKLRVYRVEIPKSDGSVNGVDTVRAIQFTFDDDGNVTSPAQYLRINKNTGSVTQVETGETATAAVTNGFVTVSNGAETDWYCYLDYDPDQRNLVFNTDLHDPKVAYTYVEQNGDSTANEFYIYGYDENHKLVYLESVYRNPNDGTETMHFAVQRDAATGACTTINGDVTNKTYKLTWDEDTNTCELYSYDNRGGRLSYIGGNPNDPKAFAYNFIGDFDGLGDNVENAMMYFRENGSLYQYEFRQRNTLADINAKLILVDNSTDGAVQKAASDLIRYYVSNNRNDDFSNIQAPSSNTFYSGPVDPDVASNFRSNDFGRGIRSKRWAFKNTVGQQFELWYNPATLDTTAGAAGHYTQNYADFFIATPLLTNHALTPHPANTDSTFFHTVPTTASYDITRKMHAQTPEIVIPAPTSANAVDYRATVPVPVATTDKILPYPEATSSHSLAKLTHVPEYVLARENVYYQYAVSERAIQDYEQVGFWADDATATVHIKNQYKTLRIVVDKFVAGSPTQKLAGAAFRLYRDSIDGEGKYGVVLNDEAAKNAGGLVGEGAEQRTMLLSGKETQFIVSKVEDGGTSYYRFQVGTRYLGVSTESGENYLRMMEATENAQSLQWQVEDQKNGIWYLVNRRTGLYLIVDTTDPENKLFTLSSSAPQADDPAYQMKLWVVDGNMATRGLALDELVGKRVVLYNTSADIAVKKSADAAISVVQPSFVGGLYKEYTPRLTVGVSGNTTTLSMEGKYLGVSQNGVLGFDESYSTYTWKLEYDETKGNWTVKSADESSQLALKYDTNFVVAEYDESNPAFRFLIFGKTTEPLTPLTEAPVTGDKIAIFYASGHAKLYYQYDTISKEVSYTPIKALATEKTTDNNGAAEFIDLKEGTYYLEETQAPDGYNLLEEPIQVIVTETGTTDPIASDEFVIDKAVEKAIKVHIPNSRGTKIIIDKFQNGDRSQKLGGAEFLLYRYPTQEELAEHNDWTAETVLYYMLDQNSTPGFTPERENATPQTTDNNGYAEFLELSNGVYYVVETKAPIDYRTRSDVMKLVVGQVENETSAVADDIILTNPAERVMAAHVPNYPDSTLPATGGQGAAWMQGAAIALLTLGGAYLLYNALRKRREQDPDHPAA